MKLRTASFVILSLLFAQPGLAASDSGESSEQKQLKITRITPSGEDVPAERQIVFQFNRPVVPLGRMERSASEIPVNISPKLECQWRWLNTSSLACQLDDESRLREATRYQVTVNPGIHAEDGATIGEAFVHEFVTQRPKVEYAWFRGWKSPGTPVIQITFNQSVSKSSAEKYLAFAYPASETGEYDFTQDLEVEKDPSDRVNPRFIVVPGESYVLDFGENTSDGGTSKVDDDPKKIEGEIARRVWLALPREELPLDSHVDLIVMPGLASALGKETGTESRSLLNFWTFPEFKFLGVTCTANNDKKVVITPANVNEVRKCNPLKSTALSFSAPVFGSQVKKNVSVRPSLGGGRKDYDPWANHQDYSGLRGGNTKGARYDVRLPERLKAAQDYRIQTRKIGKDAADEGQPPPSVPVLSDLKDEFGRTLATPIDLTFFTDHRPPNFKLLHSASVLEQQIDSDVPLYVANLDQVTFEHKKLTAEGKQDSQSLKIDIPKVQDIQFAVPMRVREILGGKSGALYGSVSTEPFVKKRENERALFATVSPYQLHVKLGHHNTLVWVTDLATGEPVQNALVQIYQDKISELSASFETLDKGMTDSSGLLLLKGTLELDPGLKFYGWCGGDSADHCERLFVRVDKDDEIALMPLESRFEVSTYRASNNTVWANSRRQYGHIHTWGTTAQGVYRAGGAIEYKFYVRDQDNDTYIAAPKEGYKLEIVDPTGQTVHEIKDISLSEFGSFSGEYTIPESAAVGWYSFQLTSSFVDERWQPMRVLVSDFTPSPFKVVNNLNGDLFHPEEEVEVSTSAKLHSGGAYTDAETRITANLKAAYFSSKHPLAAGFTFDSYKRHPSKTVFQKIDHIGGDGEAKHTFTLPKEDIIYGRLSVESAVRDDRGKYIAASSRADFIAVDRLIGLKQTKWLYEEDQLEEIQYIVVDERGVPVAGTAAALKIERLQTKAAKVKGAGNAYLTTYVDKWIEVGTCEGISEAEPLSCSFTPSEPGIHKITAVISDTKGRAHSTESRVWVAGAGRVVWHAPNNNSLQLVPEKTSYNIGDKARYLVKNPYPGAKALISIERYGVLKSWVQVLEGSTPVVEFDVEKDFLPGFYLSVIVTSPRVDTPPPEFGQIDLGKPAFKIGYVEVPVKDPYKQIDVTVQTDAEVYKPRERVMATIHAEPKHKDKDESIEIAVAVLDEAVLDLVQGGKTYFDPYEGFYELDGLDLRNYSLLKRLIGRQKFEKKGANPGGDGGADLSIRSLFKYVSYWNPSIKVDKDGNAAFDFEVPDNLTGWRILAIAVTPTDRMGLGDANFKVNRPTEIRPVMPNQVTEGDAFQAGFSVMNRTDKPRDITVTIQAAGHAEPGGPFSETLALGPYKRTTVFLPVVSAGLPQSRDQEAGAITFTATAKDFFDGDGIEHTVPVYKRRSLETAASYGSTIQDSAVESIQFPEKIHIDVGDLSVVLSPSVIGNIEGAFRYIRRYPYSSWEHQLTKGVMASHYQNLKGYLPDDLIWEGSKTLPDDTLKQAANFQSPNGGMAYFIPKDQHSSPFLSAYTALAFNWLRDSGRDVPGAVESKLHAYLERLLRKDVVPAFYSRGMSSTVRAAALAALARHGKVSLNDLERYRTHVQHMSLFGRTHYLQAALDVEGAEGIAKEAANAILAHAVQSGGKFSFNEELDDSYARILATPLRANCAILSAFTKYGGREAGAELVGDVPFKLVRSITQARGNRDHWENTQENIFCMNALVDYSRIYEKVKPNLNVIAKLDTQVLGRTTFEDLRDDAITLVRPVTKWDPGTKRKVTISRSGEGRLYYAARMSFSPLEGYDSRVNAGIDIRKEYSAERNNQWVLLGSPAEIKRGELVRVDIFVSVPTARNFVVVDDPVPGGLEPVNRDLATTSITDADQGAFQASGGSWWFKFDDWHNYNVSRWSFYHKELRHNAARFYADYLPAGNYHLSYTAQAIAEGEFAKLPVHAEEMYDPDVFGKGQSETLKVGEQ